MFLNYSVAWSSVPFGPTVKIVGERGSICYAYVEFWAVFFVLANYRCWLRSSLSGSSRSHRLCANRPNLAIVLFVVLLLPTLYLLLFGTPCRVQRATATCRHYDRERGDQHPGGAGL